MEIKMFDGCKKVANICVLDLVLALLSKGINANPLLFIPCSEKDFRGCLVIKSSNLLVNNEKNYFDITLTNPMAVVVKEKINFTLIDVSHNKKIWSEYVAYEVLPHSRNTYKAAFNMSPSLPEGRYRLKAFTRFNIQPIGVMIDFEKKLPNALPLQPLPANPLRQQSPSGVPFAQPQQPASNMPPAAQLPYKKQPPLGAPPAQPPQLQQPQPPVGAPTATQLTPPNESKSSLPWPSMPAR